MTNFLIRRLKWIDLAASSIATENRHYVVVVKSGRGKWRARIDGKLMLTKGSRELAQVYISALFFNRGFDVVAGDNDMKEKAAHEG